VGNLLKKPSDLYSIVHLYKRSATIFKNKYKNDPLTAEFFFSDCITQLEKALKITQTTNVTFLELGCGVGLNPVIAKKYGLRSFYGVDINMKLIEEAKRNLALVLERSLLPNDNPPVYIWGNFFTKEQLEIIHDEVKDNPYQHLILDNPYPDSDVYEQLRIRFDSIDIFYMYPFYRMDFGLSYFLRFFRKQAKNNAILLLKDGRIEIKSTQ
jgi:SAM-dependent methyltransferase